MSSIDRTLDQIERSPAGNISGDLLREKIAEHCKQFKTSWVNLGQALYPVWKDKLFYAWGFDKFEYYTKEDLGLKKSTALKLLKTYFFIEQNEPACLEKDFAEKIDASKVPGCDEMHVLRLARGKKELNRDDYAQLRNAVFKDGKDASGVRRDLVSMMRERKEVDPDEERQDRNDQAIRKLANALKSFNRDMDTLKLAPAELLEEAKVLLEKLEEEVN